MLWENVFVTDENNVAAILEMHPSLVIQSQNGNVYKGIASNVKNSCPGISNAFTDAKYSFNFEIEKSAGMYRVTISKLKILQTGKKQSLPVENYVLEKGVIKHNAASDLSCLDALFNRIFSATAFLKNKP